MERVTGVEPVLRPWEGHVLPLYYTRKKAKYAILAFQNYHITLARN